jgi:hypothetical protein
VTADSAGGKKFHSAESHRMPTRRPATSGRLRCASLHTMSRVVGLDRSTRSSMVCRREQLNWIDQPRGLGDALEPSVGLQPALHASARPNAASARVEGDLPACLSHATHLGPGGSAGQPSTRSVLRFGARRALK